MRLFRGVDRLRLRLREEGIPYQENDSHITRLIVTGAARCRMMSDRLLTEHGIYVQPLNHPTVPLGSEGFRVIVTASPDITVAPFARRLGAEALLGTPLVFDSGDRVTGAFAGPNCRGEEKVRRLRAAFGNDMLLAAAYGDTTGDTEMLAMADEAGFRRFKG
jgi:hypothetical protein